MIYTCTFNPALDYKFKLNDLKIGGLNRIDNHLFVIGGKGINVSLLLNNIGVDSVAIGFLGGFVGDYIETEINSKPNIVSKFIRVEGTTRINLKVKSSEIETEVNANGPAINNGDFDKLLELIDKFSKEDYLIISGSDPKGIANSYKIITNLCKEKGINFIVDSYGNNLLSTLENKPFLIKPNIHELEETFGFDSNGLDDVVKYGSKLKELGALNVLISLGSEGAVLITKNKVLKASAPKGEVKNTTGSGDSMVAGFVSKFIECNDFKESLKYAVASGSASAFSDYIAKKEEIEGLLDLIEVNEV
ncbi:1-phosphofructokinase [Mycoplasmatota bacterium WC44]